MRKFFEVFLACCSVLFFFSFLFVLLEIFPNFPKLLHLGVIDYYAYKINYVADNKLVYREKPLTNTQISNFKGALYSSKYDIDVPPTTIDWSTDQNGFRNGAPIKSAEIVILGDSYVEYGDNEADTFAKRLEKKLPGLTVINLGKAGYGPVQYLEVFKKYGITKHPTYVVFCFFEGNDLRDIKNYLEWEEEAYGENDYGRIYTALTANFLQRYFMAFNGTLSFIKKTALMSVDLVVNKVWKIRGYVSPEIAVFNIGETHYKMLFGFKDSRSKDDLNKSREVRKLREVLRELKIVSEANKIIPVILYIPSQIHVYGSYTTQSSGVNWLAQRAGQMNNKDNIEHIMGELSDELNLDLISLSLPFGKEAKDGKILYYALDPHWNAEGRELAAEVVSTIMKERLAKRSRQ